MSTLRRTLKASTTLRSGKALYESQAKLEDKRQWKTCTNQNRTLYRNFLGEKIVRYVTMRDGVAVEASKGVKDQIEISGNSLEDVSQCAADIQQICRVRNKDIRKFLDGLYVSERGNIAEE